jgi:hypothetical protein
MKELPEYFNPVIDLIASYIERRVDHWTLEAKNDMYVDCGPYVQALLEHDNMILIEAVSNQFLNPPLPVSGHQTLLFMGWRFFPGAHYPNYAQMIDLGTVPAKEIAIRMVRALHFAYGVDDTFAYQMSPWIEPSIQKIKEVGN